MAASRADDLVFIVFAATDASLKRYLSACSRWGLKELLEVLVRNWPDNGPMHRAEDPVGLTQEWSEDELLQLRAAGISTGMVAVNGKVWAAPWLRQTTAGTPMSATGRPTSQCAPSQHCASTSTSAGGGRPRG